MRMTFDEAVEVILSRLETPAPEQRATRDKVRKRITYAPGIGSLPRVEVQSMDIDRDQLIYWARTKWSGRFNIPINVPGHLADSANVNGTPHDVRLPGALDESHQEILRLTQENEMLKVKCLELLGQIAALRPLAEQYERIRQSNRESARKPRDGSA